MINEEGLAVILLGHGSRVQDAGEDLKKVACQLKEKYKYSIVEICFMSRWGPHFSAVLDKCIQQKASKILVIPYFLLKGLHMVLDIPEMLQKKAREYPEVKIIMGKHLGFDESIVDLVFKRIEESKDLGDVRNMKLKPKEKYPLPPGQGEFVEVPLQEAAKCCKKEKD